MAKKQLRDRFIFSIAFVTFLLILAGCSEDSPVEPQEPVVKERGEIINTSSIGTYTPEVLRAVLEFAELDIDIQPEVTVDAVRIVYQTIDYKKQKVHASGALFIPKHSDPMPLLSVQHGTVTKRDEVASEGPYNSAEGITGLLAGSIKYVTAVPDLLGYGVSTIMHPYVHSDGNMPVIIDFLKAVRAYCATSGITLNDEVYLTGYSEGGYLTMALHKEIEKNYFEEFSLSAVAPMAGPYDLNYTMEYIFEQETYDDPAYVAFFLTAYNEVYQWDRINELFSPTYAPLMINYFSGNYSYGEINSQLPNHIDQLLHSDFITGYENGTEVEFINVVNENTLLNWAPQAPVLLIHGDADVSVPYQNALNAFDNLKKSGAVSIELETITGGTHATAGVPAIVTMIEWFETFRSP